MIFRAIPNKRDFLARAFGRLGLLSLLEQTIASRRPQLVVLTYHRIAEPETDLFYNPVISATPESFRAQVTWLQKSTRLVSLDDLIDQLQRGLRWREPMMLLTFDDGYRDNFDLAVPILQEQKAPATFFIPTAFLQTPRLPWWDYIAYVIKQTDVPRFVIECSPARDELSLEIDLQAAPRAVAIMKIIRAFLDGIITDEDWFLNRLRQCCMVDVDSARLGCELFMSWAHVRELVSLSTNLAIGSHTHSHRKLAALDQDTQRNELTISKQIIEDELGQPIQALAYPYGWAGTYTIDTKTLAAQAGYQLAFSAGEGINWFTDFDRYEIKRIGVGSADSVAMLRARCALHRSFGKSFV